MPRYNAPRNYKPRKKRQDDPFVRVHAHIPHSLYKKLKALSEGLGRPTSRLIVWAIQNEIENEEHPFANKLQVQLPVADYKQGTHDHEAGVLLMLLKRLPTGAGLDSLVLLAEDLGLSETQLLLGYMELKALDKIEEYYPRGARFLYPEGYTFVRIKGKHREMLKDALVSYEGNSLQWSLK